MGTLLVALVACKPAPPPVAADPEPSGTVTLRIAALNDFHGALYERTTGRDRGDALGGLPWLVAAVDALRTDDPDLIVLDGGDQFQGSWPVNASRGMGSIRAMELIGLDAAAVGNHEFDYGGTDDGHPLRGAFEAAAASASYPFLTANIYDGDARWAPEGVAPWTVIERKGLRIGVVGLTTTETPQTTVPAHVEGLTFADPVASVVALQPELAAADLDVTVLVAHITGSCDPEGYLDPGPADCLPDGEIGRLLTELPRGTFDVMVLGHAHTLLAHRIDDTFLLEARSSGHALGRVDLVVGPDGVDPDASRIHPVWGLVHAPSDPGCSGESFPTTPLDVGGRTLTPSPDALALIASLEAASGSLCEQIACAHHTLGRDRSTESELGNWLADAMLAAFPDADVAIQNAGGIRAELAEGPVRREHLQAVMPFDNRTLLVELTGEGLRTLLRIGTSGGHGMLQLAGATVAVDPEITDGSDIDGDGAVDDWERDRLCGDPLVGGVPIDPEATYRVVTSDFLYTGGGHLGPAFHDAVVVDEGPLLRDVFYAAAQRTEGCIGDTPLIDPAAPRIRLGACP